MTSVFVKAGLFSKNARFCCARTCQNNLFRCGSTASKKDSEKKEVVIRQEETDVDRPTVEINWKRLKRTYTHFQKYSDIFTSFFSGLEDKHDGRLRLTKQDQVLYNFRTPEDLEYWYIMTDEDGGGYSWAELRQGSNEMTLLFRGHLNQKPPGSFLEQTPSINVERSFTGTAYVETKPFYTLYDRRETTSLEYFNCFLIRLRGDGRRYWFELACDWGAEERVVYRYPIYTRGGPLWEEVEIPFGKVHSRSNDGAPLLKQRPLDPGMVQYFRFMINDGIEGPYQLEIDYIAMTKNARYKDFDTTREYADIYDPWEPINMNSGN